MIWSEGGNANTEHGIDMRRDVLSPLSEATEYPPRLLSWSLTACTNEPWPFSGIENPLY